jgi:hypothetical protein
MDNETVAAASSAEVTDPFKGENVSMSEFSKYRTEGKLPERFKPAEDAGAAPADESEETTTEIEGESETPEDAQEKTERKPTQTAKERIAELKATIAKIEQRAGIKTEVSESSPATPAPKTEPVKQQPQATADQEPTADDTNEDGTLKFATYEEFTKALARHEARKERAEWQREQDQKTFAKEFNAKLDEARGRYEDFDKVKEATVAAVVNDASISPVFKAILDDSKVLPDLIFTIGSDPAELAALAKMAKEDPGEAIRKLIITEYLIKKELAAKPADEEPPAKQTTKAPKPPAPVGGASTRTFDVSDESLSAEEWARKRTKELNNRKG